MLHVSPKSLQTLLGVFFLVLFSKQATGILPVRASTLLLDLSPQSLDFFLDLVCALFFHLSLLPIPSSKQLLDFNGDPGVRFLLSWCLCLYILNRIVFESDLKFLPEVLSRCVT